MKKSLKVDMKKGNVDKMEKLGAGQMLTNIVSFNHFQIMEQIVKMKEKGEIHLDLTDNVDEVVLLNLAMKNKNYDMLACLAKLGLKPIKVWGNQYLFFDIREHFKCDEKYGLEFANEYLGSTNLISFKLEDFNKGFPPSGFLTKNK